MCNTRKQISVIFHQGGFIVSSIWPQLWLRVPCSSSMKKGFLFGQWPLVTSLCRPVFFVSWTCDGLLFYVLSIKVCTISTSHKTLQKPPACRERILSFDWLLCLVWVYFKTSHTTKLLRDKVWAVLSRARIVWTWRYNSCTVFLLFLPLLLKFEMEKFRNQ